MINVVKERIVVDGKTYPLQAYRTWLSANHPILVRNHFIKTIVKENRQVRTYDWAAIYATAKEYNFHLKFRDDYQRNH